MSKEDSKSVKIVPLRDFVTSTAAFKTGEVATVSRADARSFIRKKAAAEEGTPSAEAATAAAKASAKKAPAK